MDGMHRRIAIVVLGLTVLSCASSKELARRSEVALGKRDYERAYKEASASLGKDPRNTRAAAALSAAAEQMIVEREQRALYLANEDTLQAADACVDLADFRAQALRDGATLAPDTAFAPRARAIRRAAAADFYARGVAHLEADTPKQAYHDFVAVRRYAPGYRDVDARVSAAWERAVTRVAVLPFDDDTGVPNLSREMADHMMAELAPRLRSKMLEFTQLVPASSVYGAVSVSQLGDLSRGDAIDIGRRIGARRVVFGHFHGLNTHSDRDRYHGTVWRKFTERDSTGNRVERYVDFPFDAVQRWRQVELRMDFEVIDVNSEAAVGGRTRDVDATARTVYTSFVPEGDCDAYCLAPPALKDKDPDRCAQLEHEWASTFRSWTVPKLLERSKRDHARTHYRSDDRATFIGCNPDYPVFLDDIPSTPELVEIALDDSWSGVLDELAKLDPEE